MNDQGLINQNSSFLNGRKPLEKTSKENNFSLDLKKVYTSGIDKKNVSFSGAGGISDRGPKGDAANKIKQALTTKYTNTLAKKRSVQPDRMLSSNSGERFHPQPGFGDNQMRQSYNNFKKFQAQNGSSTGNSYTFDKKNSLGTASLKENV